MLGLGLILPATPHHSSIFLSVTRGRIKLNRKIVRNLTLTFLLLLLLAGSTISNVYAVQYGRPDNDDASGGWTFSEGATLWGCVDESSADDGDYIDSGDAGVPAGAGIPEP